MWHVPEEFLDFKKLHSTEQYKLQGHPQPTTRTLIMVSNHPNISLTQARTPACTRVTYNRGGNDLHKRRLPYSFCSDRQLARMETGTPNMSALQRRNVQAVLQALTLK